MKAVAAAITALTAPQIAELEKNGYVELIVNEAPARIELADVEVLSEDIPGWLVANEGAVTVALDITVTPELRLEGIARELVNRIQNMRKSNGFEITDRINVIVDTDNTEVREAVDKFGEYIAGQVLATALVIDKATDDAEALDLDGVEVKVKITRN